MYEIKLTDEAKDMLNNQEDCMYIPVWIIEIYNLDTALICSLIEVEWIENVISWECRGIERINKNKKEKAFINLVECWILKIEWEKLVFDFDRFKEMNHLWFTIENEKNKEYIWIWDEETVEKYEMMTKFVRKYLRTNGTK